MAKNVFLLATGSFNPPTIMHLRMMEIARDHLRKFGFNVVGGALTPVHDGYGKKGLLPAEHRVNMLQLALQNHDWLKVSTWEATKNSNWTRTRKVVEYHRETLLGALRGAQPNDDWLPSSSEISSEDPVHLRLVCGADYLESFNIKDLWQDEDMLSLVKDTGLVVITREGNDPMKSIWTNDILHANQSNIHLVHEWIGNDISSTKIRTAIRRSESIRYIVPDSVIEYIKLHKLYSGE